MYNNTFLEYYRNAIKAKYERQKDGDRTIELKAITTAKLRDLCMKRFKSNTDEDDLEIFSSFFEFEFDPMKKNLIKDKSLNKLKSIRRFFLGITEDPTEETFQFAAILLDFQPRPFRKFSKIMEGKTEEEIIQELAKNYNYLESESHMEETDIPEITKDPVIQNQGTKQIIKTETPPKDKPKGKLNLFRLFKRSKRTLIGTAVIFGLIASTICLLAFKKGCMQWSDNHYELVYCDKPMEGNLNEVILRDDNLLNFKKLIVCDTTTCFKPDGEAIVWYAKRGDKADFFNSNGNGRHPETKKSLRPITEYIKGKYKGNCPTK
jgi:hypothetical protein